MVSASYYRFMVIKDYMVRYEGPCDQYTESCYIGCEDDECSEQYFYTEITRHANDIYSLCGEDITDCEAANTCSPIDRECSVAYCDLDIERDACETISEVDRSTSSDNLSDNTQG